MLHWVSLSQASTDALYRMQTQNPRNFRLMLYKADLAVQILFRLLVYTRFARVSNNLESILTAFATFIPKFSRQCGHLGQF